MAIKQNFKQLWGFRDYLERLGFAENSITEYCSRIRLFLRYLARLNISEVESIHKHHIDGYLEYLKAKGRRLDTRIYALKRYFAYLEIEGMIKINPFLLEGATGPIIKETVIPRPDSHYRLILEQYKEHLEALGKAQNTVRGYYSHVGDFLEYLENCKVLNLSDVRLLHLSDYRGELSSREHKGKPYSSNYVGAILGVVKSFFSFLIKAGKLYVDPSLNLEGPRRRKHLPRTILETYEMASLIRAIDTGNLTGIRDKAIVELLYGSALRSFECRLLRLEDLNLKTSELRIMGKGNKEAIVPMNHSTVEALSLYLTEARALLLSRKRITGLNPYVFISLEGGLINAGLINWMLQGLAKKANIKKPVSAHILRHSCATHLLKAGADIRHIQRLLRHARLDSTQIYTRVDIGDLHEMQKKYHPRESRYQKVNDESE